MSQLTASKVFAIFPNISYASALLNAMASSGITLPVQQAGFLANSAIETKHFTQLEENLNYSPTRLLEIFPKYFSKDEARIYGFHKIAIASRVYANRGGNGSENTGDGWKFRGRGLLHLSLKDNYQACGHDLGVSLINNPDLLLQQEYAIKSALWFWNKNNLNQFAEPYQFNHLVQKINGGYNGLKDRTELFTKILKTL